MATIDKAALIEAAAKAISIYQGSYLYMPDTHQPIRPTTEQTRLAEAAAPVIVAAVLKPLREQVAKWNSDASVLNRSGDIAAAICTNIDADELAALLDRIEADLKGGER